MTASAAAAAPASPKPERSHHIDHEIDAWVRHAGGRNGFADTATGC